MQAELLALKERFDLICFDLDGTLVTPVYGLLGKPGNRRFPSDWKLLPEVDDAIHTLHVMDVPLAIVTNQGGVAFGYHSPLHLKYEVERSACLLGIYLVYMCFDHPKASVPRWRHASPFRKPAPGMIWRAMQDAHVSDAGRVLMVGDSFIGHPDGREDDERAALNAGCHFMARDAFFTLFREPQIARDEVHG